MSLKEKLLATAISLVVATMIIFEVGALFWMTVFGLILFALIGLGVWKAYELIDQWDRGRR